VNSFPEQEISELISQLQADPDSYQANARLGLIMSQIRVLQLQAKPHITKALSFNYRDDYRKHLLDSLSHISLLEGNLQGATDIQHQARMEFPEIADLAYREGDLLFRLGRIEESSEIFREANHRLEDPSGSIVPHRLEPAEVTRGFYGEMCGKLDIYIKARELGLIERTDTYLVAPHDSISSPRLMDYWADHLNVVEAEEHLPSNCRPYYLDYYTLPDGRTLQRDVAHRRVQQLWTEAGRAPLLSLKEEDRDRGETLLTKLGMPDDAWHVVLHVREAGYFGEDSPWNHNRHRNSQIDTYIPAIKAITDRGGWVFRIGDPSMEVLPDMPGVISAAHADWRADWTDIFLIASARFYFGMASGPSTIPMSFGIPILGTNWIPLGPWTNGQKDLFMPKVLRNKSDGRILSLKEALTPPLFGTFEPALLDTFDIIPEDNSPDDLRDAAVEMMDRLEGTFSLSGDDEELQNAIQSMADPLDVGATPLMARDFLRRHPQLAGLGTAVT